MDEKEQKIKIDRDGVIIIYTQKQLAEMSRIYGMPKDVLIKFLSKDEPNTTREPKERNTD